MSSTVRTLLREVERLEREVGKRRSASNRTGAAPVLTGDPVAFAKALGLEPDPWQERLLRSSSGRILLNCSRQSGKSTMAALLALHKALGVGGSLIVVLGPSERQAKELFSKVAGFYGALGHPIPASSYRKLGMDLANGSRIEALPGTEKTIRGFSGVDLLILDEAARIPDELYHATRPMLAVSGGSLLMLSTPFGKRGAFYRAWEDGGAEWERYEVPASECPRITPAFLSSERKALGPWWFAQEYECRFMDAENALFSHEVVERALDAGVAPLF